MVELRELEPDDSGWLERVLRSETAGPRIVSRGRLHDGLTLRGLIAMHEDDRAGVLLHNVDEDELEVVFIATTVRGVGAGAALLDAALDVARANGCARACVITTNDNTSALRFYQRCGWNLVAVHLDAATAARDLKPEIPTRGNDGIPIDHELELERRL